MELSIEPMTAADWAAVREVYAEGIATGQATFDERPPSWEEWDRGHLAECRLVARRGERVVAFAALSPVSSRPVYRGVAEVSLYVAAGRSRHAASGWRSGRRWCRPPSEPACGRSRASIFPENRASLALCEALGCRVVGVRERFGKMGDRWRDVVLVERRSRD